MRISKKNSECLIVLQVQQNEQEGKERDAKVVVTHFYSFEKCFTIYSQHNAYFYYSFSFSSSSFFFFFFFL
jgi:hypothetical protein